MKTIEPFIQPRSSPQWFNCARFLCKVCNLFLSIVFTLSVTSFSVFGFVRMLSELHIFLVISYC